MYVVGAIVVIEMMVDEKDDRERHRVVKLVIKEWRKAKNAEPEICVSFIAIREHLTEEKSISFGHCPKRMGGGPCPNFLLFFPLCCPLYFDINIMLCDTFWSFLTPKSSKVPKL